MRFQFIYASILSFLALGASHSFATRVVGSEIQINPGAESNAEYGVIYSSTGLVPGRLQLLCKNFIDEDSWDGTKPEEHEKPCGSINLKVRLSSLGISLFYMNYPASQVPSIRLYDDPESVPLRAVLGMYVGGKAGAGVDAGARTMILRNKDSGLWAVAGQVVSSGDVGIDLSVPTLEVYLDAPADLKRSLASFVDSTAGS